MDKYTCENLVIDPETRGLEDAIGKEVYFSVVPLYCLKYANENYQTGILIEIRKDNFYPFRVENATGEVADYACIIPKKEEPKPEYVSFESTDEFINAYDCANYSVRNGTIENKMLNYGGMWIKEKDTDNYSMVTEIWRNGVTLASDQCMTSWNELLESYVFLDSSPCGKLAEAEHECV